MASTRFWAEFRGYDYKFYDDSFFGFAPSWYREKVNNDMLLVTDLARLVAAKNLLKTHDRVVWVDADILIFDPHRYDIAIESNFAYCKEIWIQKLNWMWSLYDTIKYRQLRNYFVRRGVNNAVMVYRRHNSFLDFHEFVCESIVRNQKKTLSWEVGTDFLSRLNRSVKLPLLTNTALLSPLIVNELCHHSARFTKLYGGEFGSPVYAANLCSSMVGRRFDGITLSETTMRSAMHTLVESKGDAINQFVPNNNTPC